MTYPTSTAVPSPPQPRPHRGDALHVRLRAVRQRDDRVVGVHVDDAHGAVRVADGLHHCMRVLGLHVLRQGRQVQELKGEGSEIGRLSHKLWWQMDDREAINRLSGTIQFWRLKLNIHRQAG